MTKIKYLDYHKIILGIFLIGIVNLFSIVKHGIIFNIPSTISYNNNIEYYNKGILTLDTTNVKVIALIIIIMYLIFQSSSHNLYLSKLSKNINIKYSDFTINNKWGNSIEYELLVGLGLIGLILILLSKEIISLYLGIEFYSFTTYVLILVSSSSFSSSSLLERKEKKRIVELNLKSKLLGRVSIVYLILSSLASGIFLLGLNYIYYEYGIIDLSILKSIPLSEYSYIYQYLLVIALLFKLGTVPFNNWLIRLYADLDKRILWYQLTLPKLVYFLLLVKLINYFSSNDNLHPSLLYILYIIGIISIIVGSIGGLFQQKDSLILSYSSILNIGYLILALSLILFQYNFLLYWLLFNFILIYILNLMGLLSTILIFSNNNIVFNIRTLFSYPYLFICTLIILFSLIGIPPFSGFFSKFYIIFSLYTNNYISILSIFVLIFSSVLSAYFYLKFLFSSISSSSISTSLPPSLNSLPTLILSYSTIFTIFYPLFVPYLIPLLY